MVVDFPLFLSAHFDDWERTDFVIPVDMANNDHVDVRLFFTHDLLVLSLNGFSV